MSALVETRFLLFRLVPKDSRLRVVHLGEAHNAGWAQDARGEMKRNPRYIWKGEVPGWQVRRHFARSHAMVISSLSEGGANIVSEAVVCGVPIIASRIDGNVGLLGEDYDGYYPAGDERALADLLYRAETDADNNADNNADHLACADDHAHGHHQREHRDRRKRVVQ